MSEVYVIGVGTTRFGRFPDANIRTLAQEATHKALSDAGLDPTDVESVFFANAVAGVLSGQEMIRGQVALRDTGLLGTPIVNVENACASASSAFQLAVSAVQSGAVDVAMAVGAEKLTHPDKSRSFAAIGTAVDLLRLDEMKAQVNRNRPERDGESEGERSFFMDIYAATARDYMARSGATQEDFAQVAVKSHDHAVHNPNAQYNKPLTVEEVLASREISWPLTLLMCSPIGDGAAAVVVCSEDYARRRAKRTDARVRSCVLLSGRDRSTDEPTVAERAALLAYERAGLGPEDLDVIELHDAAAPAELTTYEELRLCELGGGPELLRSGATRLGGRVPVNPSGGLLSRGHPIGATGCAQIVELVMQLRGDCGARQVEGARVALAENGGGSLGADGAAMVITILSN